MKIRPLQDRVIVKRLEEEEKTKGGIIIPDSAKEKPQEGKVIAVGKGKTHGRWEGHPSRCESSGTGFFLVSIQEQRSRLKVKNISS